MAKVDLYNQNGSKVSEIELNDSVFGIEPNQHVLFEAVISQRASLRHIDILQSIRLFGAPKEYYHFYKTMSTTQ